MKQSLKLRTLAKQILTQGNEHFNTRLGIVSHIKEGTYTLVEVQDPNDVFCAGDSYNLESTYCRDVFRLGKTIALTEIDGVKGLKNHPLYLDFSLEVYISSPIMVQNRVWGTINFSSIAIRSETFSQKDVDLIESYAEKLGLLITKEKAHSDLNNQQSP